MFLSQLTYALGRDPEISVVVTREGEFIRTVAHADLEVTSAALVWSVLTDYERYPRFITNMRESRIIERTPEGSIVEQKGSLAFLFFSRDIEIRLRVAETPPDTIESHVLAGDFKVMDNRYELRQNGGQVLLSFVGRLQPGFSLPPIFGMSIARSVLTRNFTEMVGEILRRDAEARAQEKKQ